ncbi:hypothetical protein RJT34_05465 [Clitoria ternatea]|uniref:Uncharacterized protein n=1 Tax=Clitoria ternatea TaxID=43366 RepID=A0AAN9K363_CLITE
MPSALKTRMVVKENNESKRVEEKIVQGGNNRESKGENMEDDDCGEENKSWKLDYGIEELDGDKEPWEEQEDSRILEDIIDFDLENQEEKFKIIEKKVGGYDCLIIVLLEKKEARIHKP